MRFELEQRFSAPRDAVERAFLDADVLARVASLPHLRTAELLEQRAEGDVVRRRVRFAFRGRLSPAVTAVVDPSRLSWVDDSVFDTRAHRGRFRILPDHYADRLSCAGTVAFELDEIDGRTRRLVMGDLRVRMPLVGGRAERAIVSGLRDHAAAEARVVQAWLDERARGDG